jgi:hypothetical protein
MATQTEIIALFEGQGQLAADVRKRFPIRRKALKRCSWSHLVASNNVSHVLCSILKLELRGNDVI